MSGAHVGILDGDRVIRSGYNAGNIGNSGHPGNAGSPGNPGNRGANGSPGEDVFDKLLR
jgi:hypothetical protein